MKNKNIPLIIIVISLLLTIANIVTVEEIDKGFYLRISSSVLLILAMVLTIRHRKKNKSE